MRDFVTPAFQGTFGTSSNNYLMNNRTFFFARAGSRVGALLDTNGATRIDFECKIAGHLVNLRGYQPCKIKIGEQEGCRMTVIGTIGSLWRYPVKSMAGESMAEAYAGFPGFYGDRCYAFRNSAARKGFPYLNANVQRQMLLYRPKYRFPTRAAKPPNLVEASSIAPGVNPVNAELGDMDLEVLTPSGAVVTIDDPALIDMLVEGLRGENRISLARSDRALTDCRPVSLISLQTVRQIGEELGDPLDERRFRSNIYLDLASDRGFAEDDLIGRKLRLGPKVEMAVLERDPRCRMISLDPDTSEHNPEVFRKVAQAHEAFAGVYCAVLVEGVLSEGDAVKAID